MDASDESENEELWELYSRSRFWDATDSQKLDNPVPDWDRIDAETLLVTKLTPRIIGVVLKRFPTLSRDDARDIAQKSFIAVARMGRKIPRKGKFLGYMSVIALRAAGRLIKTRTRLRMSGKDVYQQTIMIADSDSRGEIDETVEAEFNKLKPSDRIVLYLYYFQGLSVPEIATTLDSSISAIEARKSRALEKIRSAMKVKVKGKLNE